MKKHRVFDLSLSQTDTGWLLYIPIATGHLELRIEAGEHVQLDHFLSTAMASPPRRMGEDPTK